MSVTYQQNGADSADGSWLDDYFPLHNAAFHNDVKQAARLLRNPDTNTDGRDTHGNTPLHLACMLGHKEIVKLLLAHGADMSIKNNSGWKSLHEAISFGNRHIIELLLVAHKKQSHQNLATRLPRLREHLAEVDDFYMESKWEFCTWIPLLSRIMPSDVFKIYKHGARLRVDFTLIDFNDKGNMPSWMRGDVTMLLDLTALKDRQAVLMDNQKEVYQVLRDKNRHLQDELDLLMSSDIIATHISTRSIQFVHAKNFLNYNKTDQIGSYKANLFHIKGMHLVTKKRREHLSKEDLKRNKDMQKIFSTGKLPATDSTDSVSTDSVSEGKGKPYRKSLSPPSKSSLNWAQYLRVPDQLSHLGRPIEEKVNSKEVKGLVAMSPDFPLDLDAVLQILDLLEPVNPTMAKLREFCNTRMPDGFPIRIEIPVFATIQAKISFQHFQWCSEDTFSDELFQIPAHYREDSKRFSQM